MSEFRMKYAKGPMADSFPEKKLRIGAGMRMSFGHGSERTFHLPKEAGISDNHVAIHNKGTLEDPRLILTPGQGKTTYWVPGTRYYTALAAEGAPLVHGMLIRMGEHYFEIEHTPSKDAKPTPAPKPAPKPQAKPSTPASDSSRLNPAQRIGSALVAGVKSLWTAGKRKKEPAHVLYSVTTEDRPRASIPRPVTPDLVQRHEHVLERVVNYGRNSATKVASERQEQAQRQWQKTKSGSREEKQALLFLAEANAYFNRIGYPSSGTSFLHRSLGAFLKKLQVRDPVNPNKLRNLSEDELRFGARVIRRNLEGKEVVDLAVVPKIHEGKLVGHEVHVMLPQLIKAGQRMAKQLARFYKHDVHLVAYPFAKK